MANRNFPNGKSIYINHVQPVLIDCSFTVTNSNGLGITNLSGSMVQNVFMHTTTTPAAGNSNPASPNVSVVNPNPIAGVIIIQLQDSFNTLLSKMESIASPNSGSALKIDNSVLVAGTPYTITVLGDASAATWHALGVPAGVTPAVGVSFIAASDGGSANVSTSRVQAAAALGSSVASIEIVGNPNLSINPSLSANQGFGAQIILECRDYAGALVAPANGSVIDLALYLNNSGVM